MLLEFFGSSWKVSCRKLPPLITNESSEALLLQKSCGISRDDEISYLFAENVCLVEIRAEIGEVLLLYGVSFWCVRVESLEDEAVNSVIN